MSKRYVSKMVKEMTSRMEIFQQIAKSINVDMTYEEIINEVSTPLRSVLAYDLFNFIMMEKGQLVVKASNPMDPEVFKVGFVFQQDYKTRIWNVYNNKKVYVGEDISQEPNIYQDYEFLQKVGIKSVIIAPLLIKNEVIGTVNFGNKEPYAYSEQDVIFVQQLADQLAVCINNARLFGEVLKSKREWEETFKAVPDKLFLIDRSFNVLRCNKNEDMLLERNGMEHKCYHIIDCCGSERQICPALEAFKTGMPVIREITNPKTGSIFNHSAYPVYNESNELYAMIVCVNDITANKKMQSQLIQSAKLAAIGEMAAGVAHELNSPLTAIIGNAGLILRNNNVASDHYKLLEDIKSCGQRSMQIIRNLLTFTRQDSYTFEPVSVNEVVENSLHLISYQIKSNTITIEKELSDNIPMVMGNKQQLEQIVINFILNARDALKDVIDKKIVICTGVIEDHETESPAVVIKVTDNGCGIEPNVQSEIFTPFFTTKDKTQGTGLGLSVSLGIAQTHHGRIELSSEPGSGSTFTLILPVDQAQKTQN
ncbi:MAG: ATP-binding protein [Pelotomaculum sp.]